MNDSDIIERLRSLHDAVPGEPPSLDLPATSGPTPGTDHPWGRRVLIGACAVVLLIGVGMVLRRSDTPVGPAGDPTATSSVAPPATGGHRPPSVGMNVQCGDVLPMNVTVADATAGPLVGPAGGLDAIPAAGASQLILHWDRPDGSVEIRWPADPRPLYDPSGSAEPAVPLAIGAMSGDPIAQTLKVFGPSPTESTPFMVLQVVGTSTSLPPPCDRVQLRVAAGGLVETIGLSTDVGSEALGFDLGPLVGPVSDRAAGGPEGASIECTRAVGPTVAVSAAPIMASPAEALREFLAGPEGAELDGTKPQGGYHEYHVTSDDTYHYEQYTDWNEHAAITVARTGDGWSVVNWTAGRC
jgi:hypothetical protein